MSGLMEYVDIAIGNEEDAEKVFGIKAARCRGIMFEAHNFRRLKPGKRGRSDILGRR